LSAGRRDGGLHVGHDIGKSERAVDPLGVGGRGQSWSGRLREESRAPEQHGHAKAGVASKQNETTRREEARFLSGNARSHNGRSIVGAAGAGGTRWSASRAKLPYPPPAGGFKIVKV